MLRDKHSYKVKLIIKMRNKIGNERVFVPHCQHLGTQVKLGIWSSTSKCEFDLYMEKFTHIKYKKKEKKRENVNHTHSHETNCNYWKSKPFRKQR